jgi:hypothetical protein
VAGQTAHPVARLAAASVRPYTEGVAKDVCGVSAGKLATLTPSTAATAVAQRHSMVAEEELPAAGSTRRDWEAASNGLALSKAASDVCLTPVPVT